MTIHDPHRRAAIRAGVDALLARERWRLYVAKFPVEARAEMRAEVAELYGKIREKRLGKNLLTSHADGGEP